jgi:hypothetical protein
VAGDGLERVEHEHPRRVDRVEDPGDPLPRDQERLHSAVAVVVRGPVRGRERRARELGGGGGYEIGRIGGSPLAQRELGLVGRRQDGGERNRGERDDQRREHGFPNQVVAADRAAPLLGIGCPQRLPVVGPGRLRGLSERIAPAARGEGMDDAAIAHKQDVEADDPDQRERQQDDVPEQHLAEVHDVPEAADANGVEGVLAVGRDPLRIEVLLGQVAAEALHDRDEKGQHPADPGARPLPSPGGHPELAPEVDDHQRHEQLDAPQMEAVEEVPDGVRVPPVDASERDQRAREDRHGERCEAADPEDVDPGGDVGGLVLGQQLVRRQPAQRGPPHPSRPGDAPPVRVTRNPRAGGGCSLLLRLAGTEGEHQRQAEDQQHAGDDAEVRGRDDENRPVEVATRRVQVDHGGYPEHDRQRTPPPSRP